MATFVELPAEDTIALRILPHLTLLEVWKLRVLCKFFYYVVNHYIKYFVEVIDVTPYEWKHSYPGLAAIFKQSLSLRYLSIKHSAPDREFHSPLIERSLQSLSVSTPSLHTLELHQISFQKKETLNCLAQVSSSLRILHIVHVDGFGNHLNDVLQNTLLEEFVCRGTDISGSFGSTFVKQDQLRVLKLCDCLKDLKTDDFLAVVAGLSCLHTLQLEFVNCVSDRCIQTIAEFCPNLKHLEISNCLQLSWNVMEYLKKRQILIKTSSILPQVRIYREQI